VDVPAVDGAPKTADPDAALNGRPTDLDNRATDAIGGRVACLLRRGRDRRRRHGRLFRAMEPISIQDSIWKSRPRTTPMFSDV